ncbi:MAG: response regulator transcription factor [Clostridia bacterium]|nr:response regulator transcription factor [Clostridia bacterium]
MKNIAILEDEDGAAELLISYIEKYSAVTGQKFEIMRFKSAVEFLADYKSVYAVIFSDIQMPEMNGMDAAVELRKRDKTVSIIFITNLVQYAQRGYEVDAVSFLVKPVSYFDFSMKFKKALDIYVMNEERSITVNLPGGLCRISTDKLMYVEIINHRLYYHLIDGVIEMTGVLSAVEKELSGYGFLRCNKCYLVNPKFVVNVKGANVVVGNRTLQISRPRRAEFLAELANWFAGSGADNA